MRFIRHTAPERTAKLADSTKPIIGLTNWQSDQVRKQYVTNAENYKPRKIHELFMIEFYLFFNSQ